MLRHIALEVTEKCSKHCPFCYNGSAPWKAVSWDKDELVSFCMDCHKHGVEAISLGGGEPLEYPDLFAVIDSLMPELYVTVTSNGFPLLDGDCFHSFLKHLPDKIHLSIHHPEDKNEVERVLTLLHLLSPYNVTTGVNLLVNKRFIGETAHCYGTLLSSGFSSRQIILVPMKYEDQPTAKEVASVAHGLPFQTSGCLLECRHTGEFCSVTAGHQVAWCSYDKHKQKLSAPYWKSLQQALSLLPGDARGCEA
jgi:hypothetical protein